MPEAASSDRPNVFFVLVDDMAPQVVDYIQELASRFDRDYTQTAYGDTSLCGPARVGLFTGKYTHNHYATGNDNAYNVFRNRGYAQDDLLSRVRNAGYRVGYFGKFINGYGQEIDNGHWEHPGCDRWVAIAGSQMDNSWRVNIDGNLRDETENHTRYFPDKAEGFLRNGVTFDRPWFCYLSLTDPHSPYTPFPRFEHSHDNERYNSPGVEEEDLSDKSEWTRNNPMQGTAGKFQESWEGQLEEIKGVQSRILGLLDVLEETGQLENTILIFTSDNGYMFGEHGGLDRKQLPYEESIRVPFLITLPGVDLPETLLVSRLDITATILDAAGASRDGVDGRSLYNAPFGLWRNRVYAEMVEFKQGPGWRLLRDGSMLYIHLPTDEEELYDLSSDPYELESIPRESALEKYQAYSDICLSMSLASADTMRAIEEL